MKGILVISGQCPPCIEAKEKYADQITSGEIELVEFEKEPQRATELVNKYGIGMPGMIIQTNNGEVIAIT